MSYEDERLNQIRAETNKLMDLKRQLRNQEQSLKARGQFLKDPGSFPTSSIKTLQGNLGQALAPHMMPGNVGGYNNVTWPFYFQIEFDFGENPSIASNVYESGFFQVDQEAAFLLMSISRSNDTDANGLSAVMGAPLQISLIDKQSSRQFQSTPFPIQMVGNNSKPMILPTPFYLQPNAILDVQINGINDVAQTFNGSGEIQLSFFGYRIRSEDAGQILSTIFCSP